MPLIMAEEVVILPLSQLVPQCSTSDHLLIGEPHPVVEISINEWIAHMVQ